MTLMSELLEALRPEVHMAFFKQEMGAPPLMEHPFFRSALLRACEAQRLGPRGFRSKHPKLQTQLCNEARTLPYALAVWMWQAGAGAYLPFGE